MKDTDGQSIEPEDILADIEHYIVDDGNPGWFWHCPRCKQRWLIVQGYTNFKAHIRKRDCEKELNEYDRGYRDACLHVGETGLSNPI